MKRSSSRIKVFVFILGLFCALYAARHFVFEKIIERLIAHAAQEPFFYRSKYWENGALIYEQGALGEELGITQLRLKPDIRWFPFHITFDIYLTEPQIHLRSDSKVALNYGWLLPTSSRTTRLDIERGRITIDHQPVGMIDFVSSEEPAQGGELIFSSEDSGAYGRCELSYNTDVLVYHFVCDGMPAHHLQSYISLCTRLSPFQLKRGQIFADIQGSLSVHQNQMQGSITICQGMIPTPYGIVDFQKFHLHGKGGNGFACEATIEGGHFERDGLLLKEIRGSFFFEPQISPRIALQGVIEHAAKSGPFSCIVEGANGQLILAETPIPFKFSLEEKRLQADLSQIPLEGYLEDLKVRIDLLQVDLDWEQEHIIGECRAKTVLQNLQEEITIDWKAQGFVRDMQLIWQGEGSHEEERLMAQGVYDFQTKQWHGTAESSLLILSKYTPLFPEGVVKLHAQFNPEQLTLACLGSHLAFQTQDLIFQVPGESVSFELRWNLAQGVEIRLPPVTVHHSALPSCVHIENGVLKWNHDLLEISHVHAYWEEVVYQGSLAYWNNPKPHIQLMGESMEGNLHHLALLNPKLKGWRGHFRCGKEGFLLDGDLDGTLPQLVIRAHIEGLSYAWDEGVVLQDGSLHLSYNSWGDELMIEHLQGALKLPSKEFVFRMPQIKGRHHQYTFEFEMPEQQLGCRGKVDSHALVIAQAHIGSTEIPVPITVSCQKGKWHLEWKEVKANGDFQQNCWSVQSPHLEMHGTAHRKQGRLFLSSTGIWDGMTLQGECNLDLSSEHGHQGRLILEKDQMRAEFVAADLSIKERKIEVEHLQTFFSHPILAQPLVGSFKLDWSLGKMMVQGPLSQGDYEHQLFVLKLRSLHALYENDQLHYQVKLQLNDIPLHAKGYITPHRGEVKLSEGQDEIAVLFSRLQDIAHTAVPAKKFSLEECDESRGFLPCDAENPSHGVCEAARQKRSHSTSFLQGKFLAGAAVAHIEGAIFGVSCNLIKKEQGFEGHVKLHSSSPLASLLKKPEWEGFENLEAVGWFDLSSCRAHLTGENATLYGYHLQHIETLLEYGSTSFELKQFKIEDPAGHIFMKECKGSRSHPLKAWEVSIPYLRGQKIHPSLIRKKGASLPESKPFQFRQLTLTDLKGIIGRPFTYQGKGMFYFTQKESRDPSLFDLPRAFLKEWGLDLSLLSPTRGSVALEISQGKCMFVSLNETFSEGNHSQFYLSEEAPSYIDFNGGLFLNLTLKQNVALKLAEPFTLTVRGTWEKPQYTLR